MIDVATLIAALANVAIGGRALMKISAHEKADAEAHEEFRSRLTAIEGAPSPSVGFAVLNKESN